MKPRPNQSHREVWLHRAPGALSGRCDAVRRVCVPRQYATFAGTAYGHTVSRFFDKLVRRPASSAIIDEREKRLVRSRCDDCNQLVVGFLITSWRRRVPSSLTATHRASSLFRSPRTPITLRRNGRR